MTQSGNIGSLLGTVVIGGGSGFIGSALGNHLQKLGYEVIIVSRQPGPYAMTWSKLEKDGLPPCKSVINVAGQNVLDPTKRWTQGFKQNVWASRVITTQALANAINKSVKKPESFVTISGVGFYEPSPTITYTEDSPGGSHDFLANLCTDWEAAKTLSPAADIRNVTIRSGVVLGRNGGMIKQIILPFYLGLGGPIGNGRHYMPWIHLEDIVGIFAHAVQNKHVRGILNGVAPQIITNRQFTKAFAKALWRPAFIPLPIPILNLAFSSERAKIMTEGQKVIPKRTIESGYKYRFKTIDEACKECAYFL